MHRWFERYSRKLRNASWELRLGVRTWGIEEDVTHPDAEGYETISYPAIWEILRALRLQSDDVVVDGGCGKGRVVCCAARVAIRQVIGVEVNPRLSRVALENAGRLRGRRAPIRIVEAPAEETDLSEGTVFFFFNPFGASTLRTVVARIAASAAERARIVRVAYVVPRHREVFEQMGRFVAYESWSSRPDLQLDHPVLFLTTRPDVPHAGALMP